MIKQIAVLYQNQLKKQEEHGQKLNTMQAEHYKVFIILAF